MLIQNGASVNNKDATGRTPVWIAAHKKHKDVCKILINNGAAIYGNDELRYSARHSRIQKWYVKLRKMFNIFTLFPN